MRPGLGQCAGAYPRAPQFEHVRTQRGPCARIGVKRPDAAFDLLGAAAPVHPRLRFLYLVSVTDTLVALRPGLQAARRDQRQCAHDQVTTEIGQPVMQAAGGVGLRAFMLYRDRRLQQHRTGVKSGVHLHDADAGLTVARLDGTMNRRRAAPAWQ
jgi:hypothetical protein